MGSKGSNTTTTSQTQTYSPNPVVGSAGTQAINMAQNAASTPFSLPNAPVAGLTPDQLQAFQQYRDIQGMAQPYYNQAQGYMQGSAAPITGQDVAQYYNPMADRVLANLHETQGQQMGDLTGRLTQTAGGVGASRIAVGQSELARQHNLAEGQTLSGLYDRALGAAQQQKQMMANAGYGIANLGTTAQGSALQGTGALNQSGNFQQGYNQAVLNSPYQNELARLAYPFQTAQFLAGITGGLSGAMGGTTSGTGTTTGPAPSIWSQLLGAGVAGAGMAGQMGLFGGGGSTPGSIGVGNYQMPTVGYNAYGYADGGSVDGNWMDDNPYIPRVDVRSQANSGAKLDLAPKGGGKQSSGPGLMDIAKVAMMFINRGGRVKAEGGAVDPGNPWASYADGGMTFDDRFAGNNPSPDMFMVDNAAYGGELPQGFGQAGAPPAFANRFAGDGSAPPMGFSSVRAEQPNEIDTADWPVGPNNMPDDTSAEPFRLDADAMNGWRQSADVAAGRPIEGPGDIPPNAMPAQGGPPSAGPANMANPEVVSTGEYYRGLDRNLPYPDLDPKNDISRNYTKSPWQALIAAGAGMMAGTSPFAGVNIGKGLQEGLKTMEQQRSDLMKEEGVNQRARQLSLEAQKHLDQYTKMTPYQQAQIENQKLVNQRMIAAMNMKGWTLTSDNAVTGEKTWVQNGTNNIRIMKDGKIITGSMDDPKSFRETTINPRGEPTAVKELPKDQQPPPPLGVPEMASDLVPGSLPDSDKAVYRKGSPALAAATSSAKKTATDFAREASMAPQTEAMLQQMKQAYGVLNKDNQADKFLTKLATLPGDGVDQRIDYAIKANGLAAAAGKPPLIDPEKLSAMEQIRKSQTKLGMLFGAIISAREAWAGQEAAIKSTPGLTQSPLGMLKMLSSYEMVDQIARDKRQFFNNYIQKNGVPGNWEDEFHKKNPQERYIVRSMMDNLPNRKAAAVLPQAVAELRQNKNDPEYIKRFNRIYANTASYWLTGHLDMLGSQ